MGRNAVPSDPRGALEVLGSGSQMRLSMMSGHVVTRPPPDGLSRAAETVGFALDDL